MSVLFFTIFISLLLAVFFTAAFVMQSYNRDSDPERDSLLPLAEEKPRPAKRSGKGSGAEAETNR